MLARILRKWWFLLVPAAGFVVGGAAWAARQEANDSSHSRDILRVERTLVEQKGEIIRRLERIEDQLHRLLERK